MKITKMANRQQLLLRVIPQIISSIPNICHFLHTGKTFRFKILHPKILTKRKFTPEKFLLHDHSLWCCMKTSKYEGYPRYNSRVFSFCTETIKWYLWKTTERSSVGQL